MDEFVIEVQHERYGGFGRFPQRIVLIGGTLEGAEKICDALEDYIAAGTGCDCGPESPS